MVDHASEIPVALRWMKFRPMSAQIRQTKGFIYRVHGLYENADSLFSSIVVRIEFLTGNSGTFTNYIPEFLRCHRYYAVHVECTQDGFDRR